MKVKTVQIDADVEAVLRAAKLDSNALHLQGQLDRKLYTKTMKVLEQIGYKWDRGLKCHVGDGVLAMNLKDALAAGSVVNEKQTYQFFATPKMLASRMAALADLQPGDRVLEPSAGNGAIVRAIQQECPKINTVHVVELNPKMIPELRLLNEASMQSGRGNLVIDQADFLFYSDLVFDKIVMNPPFTGNQDIAHVLHAYELLDEGGTIVSVMSKSWMTGSQKKQVEFRRWLSNLQAAGLASLPEEIEAGTFSESGTEISAVLVVIRKPVVAKVKEA